MENQEIPHKTKKCLYPLLCKSGIVLLLCLGLFCPAITLGNPFQNKETHYIYLQVDNPSMTVDGVTMMIDSKTNATPLIVAKWNRVVIPLRGILHHMGASIEWKPETKEIVITKSSIGISLTLQIKNPKAEVNSKTVWIDEVNHDITPVIFEERAYIPVLFVAKNLQAEVEWSPDHKFVTLTWIEP